MEKEAKKNNYAEEEEEEEYETQSVLMKCTEENDELSRHNTAIRSVFCLFVCLLLHRIVDERFSSVEQSYIHSHRGASASRRRLGRMDWKLLISHGRSMVRIA